MHTLFHLTEVQWQQFFMPSLHWNFSSRSEKKKKLAVAMDDWLVLQFYSVPRLFFPQTPLIVAVWLIDAGMQFTSSWSHLGTVTTRPLLTKCLNLNAWLRWWDGVLEGNSTTVTQFFNVVCIFVWSAPKSSGQILSPSAETKKREIFHWD